MAVKVVFSRASRSILVSGTSVAAPSRSRRPDAALGEMNEFNIANIFRFVLQKCNKLNLFYKNVMKNANFAYFSPVQIRNRIANFASAK